MKYLLILLMIVSCSAQKVCRRDVIVVPPDTTTPTYPNLMVVISDSDTSGHGLTVKNTFIDEYGDSATIGMYQDGFDGGLAYARNCGAIVYIRSYTGIENNEDTALVYYNRDSILTFMPLGSNLYEELTALDTLGDIVASGAGTDSNMTGYGNGLEFWDEDDIPDGLYYSSFSNARVAAKLLKIKQTLNCTWEEARNRARLTASNPTWDKYNGYGKINVDSAIDWAEPDIPLPEYYAVPTSITDTIYVASWGTAEGSGVDSAHAWDIEALYANQALITPGTAVGFFRGDSIRPALTDPVRVSLIRWNNNRNGTANNWILFTAVGDTSKAKPYIGTDNCSGYVMCLRTGSVKYIAFNNLSFGGFIFHKGGDNMTEGLQYIKYLNCDFREIPALDSARADWWFSNGITASALPDTTVMAPISDISIYNCTFNNIQHKEGTINTCPTKNFRIGYNTFINSREEAIDLAGGDSNLVEYNKIIGTWNANGAAANAMKITSQFRPQIGTIIRGNLILHAGNGHGIETANINSCQIYNNTIYSAYAAEFGNRDLNIPTAIYSSFKNNYIANNLFYGTVQIYGNWGSELNNTYSTGIKYPTSTGEDYNQWSDATDAYTSNNTGAYPDVDNEEQDYYGYSFNLPTGIDIFGVEVVVRMNSYSGTSATIGVEISADGGATYSTTGYSVTSASTGFANTTLGSSTDLWGLSLTGTSFSASNFRLKVKGIAGGDNPTLDYASVNVYYKSKLRGQGYYPCIDSITYKNTFTHNTFWDIDTTSIRFWSTAAYPSTTQTLLYDRQIGTAESTQFETGWNEKTDGTNNLRNPQLTDAYWNSYQDYGTFTLGVGSNEIGDGIYIPAWIKNFNGQTVTNPPNRGAY